MTYLHSLFACPLSIVSGAFVMVRFPEVYDDFYYYMQIYDEIVATIILKI